MEGIKLYLDHTEKWKSALMDVGDEEWAFVSDEYQQVHTSCAHDIVVSRELALRVTEIWRKFNEQVSKWNAVYDCLNTVLNYRHSIVRIIRMQIPLLAQQVLEQQENVDKLDAILSVPSAYKHYLRTANTRVNFERSVARVVENFDAKREVARLKLTR